MSTQNNIVQFSGTVFGNNVSFNTGSATVAFCMLVAQSGTGVFVPVQLSDLK